MPPSLPSISFVPALLECLQERTGIAPDKWLLNISGIGKTAAASVLLALADLLRTRAPADGARILLGAFGAGLTWCAVLLEWGVPANTGLGNEPG